MDTVLGTFAGRAVLAVTLVVTAAAALAAPAGASATPAQRGGASVHARVQAADVQIGHAVKYVVRSDGSIVRVR